MARRLPDGTSCPRGHVSSRFLRGREDAFAAGMPCHATWQKGGEERARAWNLDCSGIEVLSTGLLVHSQVAARGYVVQLPARTGMRPGCLGDESHSGEGSFRFCGRPLYDVALGTGGQAGCSQSPVRRWGSVLATHRHIRAERSRWMATARTFRPRAVSRAPWATVVLGKAPG